MAKVRDRSAVHEFREREVRRGRRGVVPMRRTTIMLPEVLRTSARSHARRRGVSLGALIRAVLEAEVEGSAIHFLDRKVLFRGPPLPGAPEHHDDIYESSEGP